MKKINLSFLIIFLLVFIKSNTKLDQRFLSLTEIKNIDRKELVNFDRIDEDDIYAEKLNELGENIINKAAIGIEVNLSFWLVNNNIESPKAFPSGVIVFPKSFFTDKKFNDLDIIAILSHEIAHIAKNHFNITNITKDNKISSDFNKNNELEADIVAATYLRKLNINPKNILKTYEKFENYKKNNKIDEKNCSDENKEVSTHPSWDIRLCYLKRNFDKIEKESLNFYKAIKYSDNNQLDEAIELFEDLEKTYFSNSIEVLNNLGLLYYKKYVKSLNNNELIPNISIIRTLSTDKSGTNTKFLKKSLEKYEKIFKLYPIDEISKLNDKENLITFSNLKKYLNVAYNNYAIALVKSSDIDNKIKAKKILEVANENLIPNSPITINNLAFVEYYNYSKNKDKDIEEEEKNSSKKAITFLEKIAFKEKWGIPKFNLAVLYLKIGEKDKAIEIFKELLSYPNFYELAKKRIEREKLNIDINNKNKIFLEENFNQSIDFNKNYSENEIRLLEKSNLDIFALNNKIKRISLNSPLAKTYKNISLNSSNIEVKNKYGNPDEIEQETESSYIYFYNTKNGILSFIFLDNKVNSISLENL